MVSDAHTDVFDLEPKQGSVESRWRGAVCVKAGGRLQQLIDLTLLRPTSGSPGTSDCSPEALGSLLKECVSVSVVGFPYNSVAELD